MKIFKTLLMGTLVAAALSSCASNENLPVPSAPYEECVYLGDKTEFAVWSPEKKQAPFICIEPWCGRCDAEDFDGELKDREFTNVLEAKEKFATEYTMIFE